ERDHLDAARAELLDVLGKPARAVEALADRGQALLGDALEADREHAGARAGGEVEEFGVAGDVDGCLAHPLHALRDEATEELLGLLGARDRVVVEEEQALAAEGPD